MIEWHYICLLSIYQRILNVSPRVNLFLIVEMGLRILLQNFRSNHWQGVVRSSVSVTTLLLQRLRSKPVFSVALLRFSAELTNVFSASGYDIPVRRAKSVHERRVL